MTSAGTRQAIEGNSIARPRFLDIDAAKGIAIVLVVFGHMVGRTVSPPGNDWFREVQSSLYTFHMSFFFYLAGYTFFNTPEHRRLSNAITASKKMLAAYLALGLAVYAGKHVGSNFGTVDNFAGDPASDLASLLLQPMASYAPFLWFICAVIPMYFLTLGFLRFGRVGMVGLLLVTIALHIACIHLWTTPLLSFDLISRFYVFFAIAWLAVKYRPVFNTHIQRWFWMYFLAWIACLIYFPFYLNASFAAALSIPVLHGVSIFLADRIPKASGANQVSLSGRVAQGFEYLGRRTYTIYLFNSILMGFARFILLKIVAWDNLVFLAYIPILLGVGLLGPLMTEKMLTSRLPRLSWYIR